jgi:hypothetical protein
MIYQCAKCGKEVEVKPDQEPKRTCDHEGVAVVVSVEARCLGGGKIKG